MSWPDPNRAIEELHAIQTNAAHGQRPPAAFARACALISHPDSDCRWQALIAVGGWIASDPELVWQVVLRHGATEEEDLRAGVGCVLLEHLLDERFDGYFPRLASLLEEGAPCLADTFTFCWRLGQSDEQWREIERLKRRVADQAASAPRGRGIEVDQTLAGILRHLQDGVEPGEAPGRHSRDGRRPHDPT